jgi:hypothetical protein
MVIATWCFVRLVPALILLSGSGLCAVLAIWCAREAGAYAMSGLRGTGGGVRAVRFASGGTAAVERVRSACPVAEGLGDAPVDRAPSSQGDLPHLRRAGR